MQEKIHGLEGKYLCFEGLFVDYLQRTARIPNNTKG